MRIEEYIGPIVIGVGLGMVLGAFMHSGWMLGTVFSGTVLFGLLVAIIGITMLQPDTVELDKLYKWPRDRNPR